MLGGLIGGMLPLGTDLFLETYKSKQQWKEDYLIEFVAPMMMYLARTAKIADRYGGKDQTFFGNASLLYDSNAKMRDLLLTKSHLTRTEIVPRLQCLMTHLDIWIKKYDLRLGQYKADHRGMFPSAGEYFDVGYARRDDADCGDFPADLPPLINSEYDWLRKDLYPNVSPTIDVAGESTAASALTHSEAPA